MAPISSTFTKELPDTIETREKQEGHNFRKERRRNETTMNWHNAPTSESRPTQKARALGGQADRAPIPDAEGTRRWVQEGGVLSSALLAEFFRLVTRS